MYNKIILVGNLTRDIELRYTQSGSAIASAGMATTRKFTQNGEKKEEVLFVDITFFGRSAEIANQYLHKGSKILVDGRLKLDQWVDKDNQKRSKHGVIVESMQMLDSKPQNGNQSNNAQTNNYAQHGNTRPQTNNGEANYQQPQQPQVQYEVRGQQVSQQQYQQNQQQPQVPPAIDVDEDPIPF